ncbi:hypothetical protein L873DRAFT_1799053, partial [Choiromyces venosus 120613-1]
MCIYHFRPAGFGFDAWVLVEWAGEELCGEELCGEELCGVCSGCVFSLHCSDRWELFWAISS